MKIKSPLFMLWLLLVVLSGVFTGGYLVVYQFTHFTTVQSQWQALQATWVPGVIFTFDALWLQWFFLWRK